MDPKPSRARSWRPYQAATSMPCGSSQAPLKNSRVVSKRLCDDSPAAAPIRRTCRSPLICGATWTPTYDTVITSTHALGHTARLKSCPDALYLSYVHSPARYVWSPELDERGDKKWCGRSRDGFSDSISRTQSTSRRTRAIQSRSTARAPVLESRRGRHPPAGRRRLLRSR